MAEAEAATEERTGGCVRGAVQEDRGAVAHHDLP